MNATQSKMWNTKQLAQFGSMLGIGYDPGLGQDAPTGKTWTVQAQCRTAQMLGRGYNPGL